MHAWNVFIIIEATIDFLIKFNASRKFPALLTQMWAIDTHCSNPTDLFNQRTLFNKFPEFLSVPETNWWIFPTFNKKTYRIAVNPFYYYKINCISNVQIVSIGLKPDRISHL